MSLLTVRDCAELNLGIYGQLPTAVAWDYYDDGSSDDGIVWGIKLIGDLAVVPFRGSDNLEDWLRDLMAIRLPLDFPRSKIGPVHPGIYMGMTGVWNELKALGHPASKIFPNGHSLGAGRARDLTALMVVDGTPPGGLVRFGSPRPGFQKLVDICDAVPQWSYQNTDASGEVDDVTKVPFNLPMQRYTDASFIKQVVKPADDNPLDLFRFHHMQLYADAAPDTVVAP